MKPIFCFNCTQRGHSVNQCKEASRSKIGGNGSGKKSAARVFALQLEEAPSVDAFAGSMLISSHVAYVLVDTGATHACISKKFMSVCKLSPDVIADSVMYMTTPFGSESLITKICRSVDVLLEDVHMPIL